MSQFKNINMQHIVREVKDLCIFPESRVEAVAIASPLPHGPSTLDVTICNSASKLERLFYLPIETAKLLVQFFESEGWRAELREKFKTKDLLAAFPKSLKVHHELPIPKDMPGMLSSMNAITLGAQGLAKMNQEQYNAQGKMNAQQYGAQQGKPGVGLISSIQKAVETQDASALLSALGIAHLTFSPEEVPKPATKKKIEEESRAVVRDYKRVIDE